MLEYAQIWLLQYLPRLTTELYFQLSLPFQLLSLCTKRLELNKTACRLYTSKGTLILTVQDLVLCAVSDFYRKQKSEERDEKAHSVPGPDENTPVLSMKGNLASSANFQFKIVFNRYVVYLTSRS